MFTGLSFTILNAQYFNGVAITSVDSGNNSSNILFSATSSTIPLLAKIRAQVISGSGNFARNGDNFIFTSSVSASASGIPNNKSQIQITFLQSNGTTLIPASDLRFIISDIDGPNNEAIAAGCSSGLKFFGISPNSNITLTNNSEIRGTGTANQNYEASSTVLLEFSKQNTIIIDTYGNNGYIKEFDLNNNNYALSTTLYTLCNSLDNDGDGITNKNDLDDDNDGILDTAESGIYNPEGDADGDGLPNYLDIVNNAGQSSFFSPDGSSTSYTDANNNGIPDVYDLDGDGLPNHLDTDSDGDGCPDAVEGGDNITQTMLNAGRINVAANGTTTPVVVDAQGVPVVTNTGSTFNVDGQAQGQTIGQSQINNPAAVGGTVGSNQTIVSGATPAALSLSGHTGTIQWQSSTDNVTFTNISGATSATYAPGALTATTYYRAVLTSAGGCTANSTTVTINIDSDGDGVIDSNDLDDDNDGILDTTEGQCINTSNPSTDGFDSPLVATVNGNNIQSVNPYNGWGTETGVANAFNVIRVNGAGYSSGPDVAQSGTQYIDINSSSAYVYKDIILTTPTVFSASAWFANRETSNGAYAPWSSNIQIINQNTSVVVAQGNTVNLTAALGDEYWYKSAITSVSLPAGTYRIRMFVDNFGHLDSISYCFSTDTDGDGTPDHLDLDSDNDGCADALEGDENVTTSQLTANRISGTVDANGVPNLVNAGGTADVGSDQGQGIGEAYNATIQSGCFCYKPAQTTGTALDTNHGITALGRAGDDYSNWPMVRKGAWTVLEAKTKGFVVNRLTNEQITAIPSADLREGMMVYNITQDCLQINIDGTATGWKCFNTQTCPDL